MKRVAILGCGPAGLLAAHAAALNGWDFRIYSKKQKSAIHGAQYFHEPIPEITCGEGIMLNYRLDGSAEKYRHKVYGESWDGNTSPEDYAGDHLAWNLRSAYEDLWFSYGDEIEHWEVHDHNNKALQAKSLWLGFDLVISTVPRTVWDNDESHFEKSYIWALGDGDYERVHMHRPDPFTVICDGTYRHSWYRVSNIFGFCTMEWPQWWNVPYGTITPPCRGAARVVKPLRYTGNAASDMIHLGRYAQWEKGVLTSDVFNSAMEVLVGDKVS